MRGYDLNLLRALKALVEEGGVTAAARRLQVSEATMSRHLAQLRKVFGDPVLVRSGRDMVPSSLALSLGEKVRGLIAEADLLVQGDEAEDPGQFERKFVIRAADLLIAAFAGPLLRRMLDQAPRCELVFAPEADDPPEDAMRSDAIDLYLGATTSLAPEIRRQTLGRGRMDCLVRRDHPIFTQGISAETVAAYDHISVSRRGRPHGPIDQQLRARGLQRRIVLVVPNYYAMVDQIAQSDMILPLPTMVISRLPLDALGLASFEFPFPLPLTDFFQAWHPKWDRDPAHRWLRRQMFQVVKTVFTTRSPDDPSSAPGA
ncbi:transcriptional regulator LysR [Novosphingobium nitrogenifigens DSM 19370]|uniref:Transcriptional regulator LysR n=1 Tax=Novosphingobium nitrogenifigens DSM 19370 TaxID=983920 RepID=F1Z3A9_9SPHN|nr:LysR family transcriptional regulator [Novosphingobium nitrogenifigens]EGD60904.1 transcriptional regulator LysR [Novosphingobium nitrogenifigens DSM 19370]